MIGTLHNVQMRVIMVRFTLPAPFPSFSLCTLTPKVKYSTLITQGLLVRLAGYLLLEINQNCHEFEPKIIAVPVYSR